MSDENQKKASVQQDTSSKALSKDESAPPTENMSRYKYDEVVGESLAKNMSNISLGLDLDDEDGDVTPYASSRGPPLPFHFDNYSYLDYEDDSEHFGIDYKISKIEGLDQEPVNSPRWYALVRAHLTALEREELWDRTPWATKYNWDDSDDADTADDFGCVTPPLYKDQHNISLT